jgi:hypothetical protein
LLPLSVVRDLHNARLLVPLTAAIEQARQADLKTLVGTSDWAACRLVQGRIQALDDFLHSLSTQLQSDKP